MHASTFANVGLNRELYSGPTISLAARLFGQAGEARRLRDQVQALRHENLTLRHGRRPQTTRLSDGERRASKQRSAARARLNNGRFGWRARLRAIVDARELGVIDDHFDEVACLQAAKDGASVPSIPDVIVRETASVPPSQCDQWVYNAWLARRLARLCGWATYEIQCLDALATSVQEICSDPAARATAEVVGLGYPNNTWALNKGAWTYPNGMPLWNDAGDLLYPSGTLAFWREHNIVQYPQGWRASQGNTFYTVDQRLLTVDELIGELRTTTELWPRFERGLAELDGNGWAKRLSLVELMWLYLRPWTSTAARTAEDTDPTAVYR